MIKKIYRNLLRLFYVNNKILILKKDSKKNINLKDQEVFEVEALTNLDIEKIHHGLRRVVLERELADSNTILGFKSEDGYIKHYSCISINKHGIGEIKQTFIIPEEAVYIYNCFTDESYRGKKLFQKMLLAIDDLYSTKDKYIAVSPGNLPSYNAIKKVGFYKVAEFQYRKIFFWENLKRNYISDSLVHCFENS